MNRILEIGTKIKDPDDLSGEYTIEGVIGSGTTCVVYLAKSKSKEGIPNKHILKEYNPRTIALVRGEDNSLNVRNEKDRRAFSDGMNRFKAGITKQAEVRLHTESMNSTSIIARDFAANQTHYAVMPLMAGETYDKVTETSLYNLLRRICAITKVVKSYHDQGLLHLDIKPENIFTLPETVELVQMFDFDSVIEKDKVISAPTMSYTQNWAAQEQILPYGRKRICEATDLFAIGEILFYKLMGRHSVSSERYSYATYHFDPATELLRDADPKVFELLSEIFEHTICNVVARRWQSADILLGKLEEAIKKSYPEKHRLLCNLPCKPDFFVGRNSELSEIDNRLKQTDKLFITGMGGMGKSELCKQYAHLHKKEYDAVIFAVCNTDLKALIIDDKELPIANIQMGSHEKAEEYFDRKYPALMKSLCTKRVLLIVDNLNDVGDSFLPEFLKLNCKMLITTRYDVGGRNYEQLSIGALEDAAHIRDLFKHWDPRVWPSAEENTAIEQILAMYAKHTLAVELIAKQMKASRITPQKMLEKLATGGFGNTGKRSVLHGVAEATVYNHIQRLFNISDLSDNQIYILANLSLLPISGINTEQFYDWCKPKDFEPYKDIDTLIDSGWVRMDASNDIVSLHPVIADIMLDRLEREFGLCETLIETITGFLHKDRPDDEPDSLYGEMPSTRYDRLIPIVISIVQKICNFDRFSQTGILFIIAAASHLYEFGNIERYITIVEKASAVYKELPEQDCEIAIKLLNAEGTLLSANCNYQLAESAYNKALKLAVAHYGELDDRTYTIKRNLISTYRIWDKKDKLEDYYAQMRPMCINKTKSFSASVYNSMGVVAKHLGYYKDAEYFYQKALWKRIDAYGIGHGLTGLEHLNLGALYLTQNNFEKADEHLEQARSILRDYYGEKHSYTATAYAQSGTLRFNQGRYGPAEVCYQKALEIRKELFGNRHVDTANSCNDLGALYYRMKMLDKAQQYYAEALTIRTSLLGKNHISTSCLLLNIGSLCMELGNLDEAETNYLEAERIAREHYTAHKFHPDLATIKNNLGMLYKEKGKYDEAIRCCSEALHIWEHVYGEKHTHIAIVHINLGVLYREKNRYAEALAELTDALRILTLIHGPENISVDTGSVYSALGKTYADMGNFLLAEGCYHKAMDIRKKLFGDEHPSVQLVHQRIQELKNKQESSKH